VSFAAVEPTPPGTKPGRRRVVVALTVFLGLAVLLVGAGVVYLKIEENRIRRVAFGTPASRGGLNADVPQGDAVNILVVGSDSRAAATAAKDKQQFGTQTKVDGQRSDTMMVVRLDPSTGKAIVLSLPRDTYVDLPEGGKGRLNEAFADTKDRSKANPDRLVRTITKNFGIPINHYVEIDFFGFRDAVDAVGGVNVYFQYPARDAYSLLNITSAGCVALNGDSALSYVRSRHFEYQENGRWHTDPTSDFGRIKRQQDFLRRLAHKAVADGLTNPVKAYRLIDAGVKNVALDQGFGVSDMRSLASQLRGMSDDNITFLSLPAVPKTVGGADVLVLDKAAATDVIAEFRPPSPSPAPAARPGRSTSTSAPSTVTAPPTTQPAAGSDPSKAC
jgi:LCP family protein required for cell wall assembly